MDALKLLREDHERIKELLVAGADRTNRAEGRRTEVLSRLKRELEAHQHREEEVLFPVLKAHEDTKALTLEGYEEHHLTDMLLRELTATSAEDERWPAKFKVLKDVVEMHLREEEHDIFNKVRNVVPDDQLKALGRRMESIDMPLPPA